MSMKSLQGRRTPGSRDECSTAPDGRQPLDQAHGLELRNYIHHRHHYYSARKLILISPSHRGQKAKQTQMAGYIPRRFNRAQCRLTTLIEAKALTTTLRRHPPNESLAKQIQNLRRHATDHCSAWRQASVLLETISSFVICCNYYIMIISLRAISHRHSFILHIVHVFSRAYCMHAVRSAIGIITSVRPSVHPSVCNAKHCGIFLWRTGGPLNLARTQESGGALYISNLRESVNAWLKDTGIIPTSTKCTTKYECRQDCKWVTFWRSKSKVKVTDCRHI